MAKPRATTAVPIILMDFMCYFSLTRHATVLHELPPMGNLTLPAAHITNTAKYA